MRHVLSSRILSYVAMIDYCSNSLFIAWRFLGGVIDWVVCGHQHIDGWRVDLRKKQAEI